MRNRKLCSNLDEDRLVIEHLYTVEDYITFKLDVKSGPFTGSSHFCILKQKLHLVIEEMNNMYKDLKGSCELKDYDSDAFITLEMKRLGHVSIFGQIGGSQEDHNMRFKFTSDQTGLAIVLRSLQTLL